MSVIDGIVIPNEMNLVEDGNGNKAFYEFINNGILAQFNNFETNYLKAKSKYSGSFTSGNMKWTIGTHSATKNYDSTDTDFDTLTKEWIYNEEIIKKTSKLTFETFDEADNGVSLALLQERLGTMSFGCEAYLTAKFWKLLADFVDVHPDKTIYIPGLSLYNKMSDTEAQNTFETLFKKKVEICKDYTNKHYLGVKPETLQLVIDTGAVASLTSALINKTSVLVQPAVDLLKNMISNNDFNPMSLASGNTVITSNILASTDLGTGIIDKDEDLTNNYFGFLKYAESFAFPVDEPKFYKTKNIYNANDNYIIKFQFTYAFLYPELIWGITDKFTAGVKNGKVKVWYDANGVKHFKYVMTVGEKAKLTSGLFFAVDKAKVTYTSGSTNVVSVDGDVATAGAVGNTWIKAVYTKTGSVEYQFDVEVVAKSNKDKEQSGFKS